MIWLADKFKILKVVMVVLALGLSVSACKNSETSGDVKSSKEINDEAKSSTWQAGMFKMIYGTAGTLATSVYSRVSGSATNLIAVLLGLWIAIKLLGHVSSLKPVDPAEFWTMVMQRVFVCALCAAMVKTADNMMWTLNTFVFPVFTAFIEFADAILNGQGGVCHLAAGSNEASSSGFPAGPGLAIECMINALHQKLCMGMALGARLITDKDSTFMGVIAGILIILLYVIVDLVFPFYLIDSAVRMGLVLALLPALIMCYAFPSTKSYPTTALKMFINTGGQIAMLCVTLQLSAGVLVNFVQNNFPYVLDPAQIDSDPTAVADMAGPGVALLSFLCIGFMTYGALQTSNSIADSLVGQGGGGALLKMAGQALGLIKLMMGDISGYLKKKYLDKLKESAKGAMKGGGKALSQGKNPMSGMRAGAAAAASNAQDD